MTADRSHDDETPATPAPQKPSSTKPPTSRWWTAQTKRQAFGQYALRKAFGFDGYKTIKNRSWTLTSLMLLTLGGISDSITVLGPAVKIGFWLALIAAGIFGVVILRRMQFCNRCVVPFITAVGMAIIFAGFTAAQALTPGGAEKGASLALLNRIDITTQDTNEIAKRNEQKLEGVQKSLEETRAISEDGFEQLSQQIAAIAKEKGVSTSALIDHLQKLGAKPDIKTEDIPGFLEKFADDYLAIRERLLTLDIDDSQLASLRKKAAGQLEAGDAAAARKTLSDARKVIKKGRQTSSIKEAILVADEAAIDKLDLNYQRAADKYLEASELVSFDPLESAYYRLLAAGTLYDRGNEFGDNAALEDAIDLYRDVLVVHTRDRVPLDWAMTKMYLGNALLTLGARESGTDRLEEAVTAYRAALLEHTRDRVALDWARTQMNLGVALWALGERESGTDRLEEAVTAYRAALRENTRDRVPLDWARTQMNLGLALEALGARESGTDRLEEAVTAYRAALLEHTRDRVPLDWATTKMNLGNALWTLGARESGTDRLEEARDHIAQAWETYRAAGLTQYRVYFERRLGELDELIRQRQNEE